MYTSRYNNRNCNRNLQTSKMPLKSQAQGTCLFTSATSNQRGCPKSSLWEAQVRIQYNTMQYNTMQCNTMQCNTIKCNRIQCHTIQYFVIEAEVFWRRNAC